MSTQTTKAFMVNLSKGAPMPCDQDELPIIMKAIQTKSLCVIRSGMFNPAYFINLVEDRERSLEIERENEAIRQNNEQYQRFEIGQLQEYKKLQPIKNIFDGVNLTKLPTKPKQKQLN